LNITQIKLNIRNILLKIIYVGAGALIALSLITIIMATIIIAPVRDLMRVAEALGSGDLSKKANVKSADELGQLGTTLNNTIDRLQGLVQTEADRDKMQHQVMDLLSIVSGAAKATDGQGRSDRRRTGFRGRRIQPHDQRSYRAGLPGEQRCP